MKRILSFLIIYLLTACNQQRKEVKHEEVTPPIDSTDDIYARRKADLNEMFLAYKDSTDFTFQRMGASLLIGHLFDKNQQDAIFRYQTNDSTAHIYMIRQSGKTWDTIFSKTICPATTGARDELIEVADFNGDNIPDLKLIKEYWDIHVGEKADLWLYSKGTFTPAEGFDNIISATYDKSTNLIYSYQSQGCADMSMYFGVFRIAGNKVATVKEMYCDCCATAGDSCKIEVFGQKPYFVPLKTAYKHVPHFYAEGVKSKCEL